LNKFNEIHAINKVLRSSLKQILMGNQINLAKEGFQLLEPLGLGRKFAFINCNFFDSVHGRIRKNATILIEKDKIVDVDDADKISVPYGSFIIDVAGMTVMPGLIDSHVHLCSPFTYDVNLPAIRQMRRQITYNNIRTVYSGVTTVCDMGGPQGLIKEFQKLTDSFRIPGPRSLNCFTLISPRRGRKLGYPTQVKLLGPFQFWLLEGQVSTRPRTIRELKKLCYKVKDDGGSHLKVTYQSYPFSSKRPPEKECFPMLDDEWMRQILRIGKETGLIVSIHSPLGAGTEKCVDLAIEVGAEIRIQHMCFDVDLDDILIKKMVDHGHYFIPTVMIYGDSFHLPAFTSWLKNLPEHHLTEEASKQLQARIQKIIDLEPQSGQEIMEIDNFYMQGKFDLVRRNTQKAHSAGIIGFGTDLGGTYTGFFGRFLSEVQHYSDFGIAAVDILKYVTSINARINNLNDRGSIQTGKLADLIVLGGNPLDDIGALGDVRIVMKGGRLLKYELPTI
jgi:imidazolonepropionase-like amidohydrolase